MPAAALARSNPAPRDPTGTAGIRRAFRAHGEMTLRRLRGLTRQVVIDYNMLGLPGGASEHARGAFAAPTQRLRTFNGWFEAEARNALSGTWYAEWINRSAKSGEIAAAHEVAGPNGDVWLGPTELIDQLHALADQELKGIAAALVQHVARIALASVARGATAVAAYRAMAAPFDKIASIRMAAFANMMTVKAHNVAKLITYRANGLERVGVTPERRSPGNFVQRANLVEPQIDTNKPGDGHGHVMDVDEGDPDDMVDILTAGDDLVCDICQDIADDAPYTLDEALDLIPAHANCRCAFRPFWDRRFAHQDV